MESGQQSRVHYVRFVIDSTAEWFWYSAAWLLLPRKMVTCFVSFRRLAMFQSDFFILFTTQNIYFFPSLLFFECLFRVLLRLVLRWWEHDFMTNHKEQVESMQKEMSKYFLISCFRLSQKNYFSRNFVRSENDTVAVAPNECGWTTKTHSKLCNNFNTNTHTHTLVIPSAKESDTTRNPEPRKVKRFSLTRLHTTDGPIFGTRTRDTTATRKQSTSDGEARANTTNKN